jgi:hypothetical protein
VATRSLLCDDPEVMALLDRLATPSIDFIQQIEVASEPLMQSAPAPAEHGMDGKTGIVLWNESLTESSAQDWLTANLGAGGGPVVSIGVWQSDSAIRASLCEIPAGAKRVMVFTKGWEPPLLEFADFLSLLRESIGTAPGITVIPIDTTATHVDRADREVWARSLSRHDDPRLYVLQATREQEAEV